MAVRTQVIQARRRQLANLRVEDNRQRRRGATEQQLAKGRAQVLLDGQLDCLRPQPRSVTLVPEVHQFAEGAAAVVVARGNTFALLTREPLAFD